MSLANPIAEDLFAELICARCHVTKWVLFPLRHAGRKTPPVGVTPDSRARCVSCPIGLDETQFTGRTRFKDTAP